MTTNIALHDVRSITATTKDFVVSCDGQRQFSLLTLSTVDGNGHRSEVTLFFHGQDSAEVLERAAESLVHAMKSTLKVVG